ncbi:hypothetical protein Ddye_016170 [Dipteronia dyeriana]|uniref:Uncharacterized protein n=1 Tax=Dipteronia dyeriana TaxID=168575 RepID=A0AAD9U6X0_9ROSI|nr:hypothetical protein Ddye_016170 [Dipteronia dyeriana]
MEEQRHFFFTKFSGFMANQQPSEYLQLDFNCLRLIYYCFPNKHLQCKRQIPSSLGQLKKLQSLDLRMNTLNSTVPPELGFCTNLAYLALVVNQLSGELPLSLSNLIKIADLG